ncbi:RHS repeat domain-containing protein [Coprobacter fastidiosus]|uniref:RHS repeat domain-containing protein n=1 Tax=Coprobacter fastidiosus TaxID=1099853 RepID=UPI003AB02CF3
MMKTDTYYFFLTDHLGSIRVVADASGSVVQRNHFYPFGLSFADNENPETQPYKFNGKELDLFHGLNWYDYLARGMDPAAGRFTAIDPLCEKYFALSPYIFCANNPVNYIDPDGKIIKIANNRVNALTYFAKIAATNIGSTRMNDLIRSTQTYTAKSVFLTKNSEYDVSSNTIYYVNDSWYSDIDGGSPSEYALLGHELDHAWREHNFQIRFYKGETTNVLYLEKQAVSFENYLRTAYGDNSIRRKYEGLKGGKEWEFFPYNLNRNNELITNFSQLGHNRNKTSLGFSYEKSVNNGKSVKQYLIISTDKNDNLNYRIFNSKEEYDKATFNW